MENNSNNQKPNPLSDQNKQDDKNKSGTPANTPNADPKKEAQK